MARGQQSKRAARRQKAKGQEAKASARLAGAAGAKASRSAAPKTSFAVRPEKSAASPWPLVPQPTQHAPRASKSPSRQHRTRHRPAAAVPQPAIASRGAVEANANARVALLLAFPLIVMMLAMLDRSGALKVLWPHKTSAPTEVAIRQRVEQPVPTPVAPQQPVVEKQAKRVAGPIQSRPAQPKIASAANATPKPQELPPTVTRLPASQSLAGPSTRFDQVAQNRSLLRRHSMSSLAGAESVRAPEAPVSIAALPVPPRPALTLPPPPMALPAAPPVLASLPPPAPVISPLRKPIEVPLPSVSLPSSPPTIASAPRALPPAPLTIATPPSPLPETPPQIAALPSPLPPPSMLPEVQAPSVTSPSLVVPRAVVRSDALIENTAFGPLVSAALPDPALRDRIAIAPPPVATPTFGERLAAAAFEQTKKEVTYDPRYVRIAYPMGDVPDYMGVCTDVVIRAYRTLGIDLQELVQKTRSGTGDTNIDHRRVLILRKFLEQHGQSLPVTSFPEDYKPGDLVTYFKPYGRTSKFHIVVISDRLTPDGRPLVIHNRGYGAKLEDVLFREKITGHYRFEGLAPDVVAAKKTAPLRLHKAAIQAN